LLSVGFVVCLNQRLGFGCECADPEKLGDDVTWHANVPEILIPEQMDNVVITLQRGNPHDQRALP
jgi:hypothetical protein